MRLIDADEFLHTTKVGCTLASMCTANTAKREILKATYELIKERIEEADTVEAEPVEHSKWIRLNGTSTRCCESCGVGFKILNYEINDYRFCPYCGARMDGGNKNACD